MMPSTIDTGPNANDSNDRNEGEELKILSGLKISVQMENCHWL